LVSEHFEKLRNDGKKTTQTLFPGFILSNQPMTKGTCAAKIKTEHSVLESLKLIEIMLVIYLNYTIKITMSFKQVGPRIHQNMCFYTEIETIIKVLGCTSKEKLSAELC